MKRSLRALALIAAVAAPAALSAQSNDKPVSFGVSAGASLPIGDLSDAASTGFVVAGHVYFKPAAVKAVRFRGDVSYDKWGAKDSEPGADADFRSLGFVANAIYDINTSSESTVKPYLIGGLGFYNTKVSVNVLGFEGSASSTDLGLQVGAGLTFKLSGFDTFAEAKFVNVFGDGSTSWLPLSFGVRF